MSCTLPNSVTGDYGTVGGGYGNTNSGQYATVGGGYRNTNSAFYATVGGGQQNTSSGGSATVGGGIGNTSSGAYATVGGGSQNTNSGNYATVGGGIGNTSSLGSATVGGGFGNTSSGAYATVGGGDHNTSSGHWATVGGGSQNTNSGNYATVPGGSFNFAEKDYSFAAGHRAKANHQGAFVWADSSNADFSSTVSNQFVLRASGGVGINTGKALEGSVMVNTNIYLMDHPIYFRGSTDVDHNHGLAYNFGKGDRTGNVPEVDGPVLWGFSGGFLGTSYGSNNWSLHWDQNGTVYTRGTVNPPSDRNMKTNFTAVNPRDVLEKVSAMAINTWEYKDSLGSRHVGPVAQDFHAAFGLGQSDKSIATVDADGVALAAIQGLHQLVKDKDAEISSLKERLSAIEKLVGTLVK